MRITNRIKEKSKNCIGSAPVILSFIGDSVTHGCFELYPSYKNVIETEYRSMQSYHHKLREMLETVFPSVCINVINAGISGDNAPSANKRLERDVISYKPDLCVVCLGLNDSMKGFDGICEYESAISSILEKLIAANIETIFMTPNMACTRVVEEEKDPSIRQVLKNISDLNNNGVFDAYMETARKVCKKYNVLVCDCYSKWKKLEENGADVTRLLANYANHPIEQMHYLFAASLFEMIMDMK